MSLGSRRRQKRIESKHAYVDGIRYEMPIKTWNASAMIAAFPCDYERARALIPDSDLQAFRLWNKAVLIVTVIDYRETDIGSYIEFSIAIACTYGPSPGPRLLPALFMKLFHTGQYVLDLPVSSEISVKGGRGIWGMPKHRANLDFVTGNKWISSQYNLDGNMVSRLDIKRPKRYWLPLNMRATNYCAFRGMMMRSFIYFRSKAGMDVVKPEARLVLGDHPRAAQLKSLNHEDTPLFVAHMPDLKGILDDYFECWFITTPDRPKRQIGDGLEMTYPLGYGQEWLPSPPRNASFDLNED